MKDRTVYGQGIVGIFVRHPNAANLLMVLMIIFGLFAIAKINTQFFPTVEREAVTISVKWTGASPEDVEKNILAIMEPEVRYISGVVEMDSYALEGSGRITLEFAAGTDMQQAVSDVDAAVKGVTNLPQEAETPSVSKAPFFDRVARLSISGPVPEATLRIHAKKIRDDLIERGIDRVDMVGLRREEIRVEIKERELRRLGLSVSDISNAIARNSRDTPSGQIRTGVEQQIRALASVDEPSSIEHIEIKSFSSGEKVLLRDVADIFRSYADDDVRGFWKGNPAIQITVQRAQSADTLATAKILDDYLAEVDGKLPPRISLQKYEVRADALVARISLLFWNGVTGLVLVVGMLFLFLNARIAFWVAAGIPVAMFATLGIMLLLGQTINMITLFAMIMMLGVIVDDAIVVGEHTATLNEEGQESFEAAENGANRMLVPVLAAMTTTVAAFAPMLLIGGIIGQIMGVMPYVVTAVILASVIECFLILPGHLAHTMKPQPTKQWSFWRQMLVSLLIGGLLIAISNRFSETGASTEGLGIVEPVLAAKGAFSLPLFLILVSIGSLFFGTLVELFFWYRRKRSERNAASVEQESMFRRWFDRNFNAFRDGPFNALVTLSYQWRYVTVAISIFCLMVLAIGPIRGELVKFVFFPSPEAENMRARIVFNAGITEDRARDIIVAIEKSLDVAVSELSEEPGKVVTAVFSTLGSAGRSRGDNLAEIRVQLASSEVRSIRTPTVVKAWRKALPKVAGVRRVSIFETRGGPPGRDIDVELTGAPVGELKQAAVAITPVVAAIDGASGVSDDLAYGKPELVMELLPRGAALGFTIDDVGLQVRQAFDGAIARKFARGDDEITIRVVRTSRETGSQALRSFELRSPKGDFVPLNEVVSLTDKQGFSVIQRSDGKTTVSVTADLNPDITTTDEAIAFLENSAMPDTLSKLGVDYRYGGRNEERMAAFADLRTGVIIALAVIYIILAWVFGDYFRPFAIMLIIPFGIVGAVMGHWLLGYKLTILSYIGLLGLAGILVNDSIILVSRLDERLKWGEALEQAAIGASRDRLRAVLLTSLTTIGGLFPLMFEKSLQAQFLLPMAITIVFGLALATLLVLFLVPALIGVGTDINTAIRQVFAYRENAKNSHPAE